MEILVKINDCLGNFDNIVGSLGLIVSIIGLFVGLIGGKEIKEANELKIQFGDLKTKIENLEISNSQVAQTINNNGLGYRDTKELAEDVVAKKTKNKPDVIFSDEEPQNLKEGDQWIAPY
jgi:hypothetical protein|nr:MAG TPA: hypothetical protein [Caudoviricetes sp.]